MKYYFAKLLERNGEFEYTKSYLFNTKNNPDRYGKKVAKEWRCSSSSDWDTECEGYWYDGTLISHYDHREIPKEDFDVLAKYIPVL